MIFLFGWFSSFFFSVCQRCKAIYLFVCLYVILFVHYNIMFASKSKRTQKKIYPIQALHIWFKSSSKSRVFTLAHFIIFLFRSLFASFVGAQFCVFFLSSLFHFCRWFIHFGELLRLFVWLFIFYYSCWFDSFGLNRRPPSNCMPCHAMLWHALCMRSKNVKEKECGSEREQSI